MPDLESGLHAEAARHGNPTALHGQGRSPHQALSGRVSGGSACRRSGRIYRLTTRRRWSARAVPRRSRWSRWSGSSRRAVTRATCCSVRSAGARLRWQRRNTRPAMGWHGSLGAGSQAGRISLAEGSGGRGTAVGGNTPGCPPSDRGSATHGHGQAAAVLDASTHSVRPVGGALRVVYALPVPQP